MIIQMTNKTKKRTSHPFPSHPTSSQEQSAHSVSLLKEDIRWLERVWKRSKNVKYAHVTKTFLYGYHAQERD